MNSTFKPTEIKELEQETYRLSLQDGVMEMFMGIMLLVTSNLYNNTLPMGVILVFLLFVFPYMSRMMKNRFTYPRTGYIKVRTTNEFQKNDLIAFVIFLTMVISLSGILILLFPNGYGDSENLYRVMPFAFGMVLFGPAMHLADKTGQDRYLMIGVLPTITGMLVSVLSVLNDPWIGFRGLQIFTIGWGFTFLLLGLVIFVNFILKNPVLEDEPLDNEQS